MAVEPLAINPNDVREHLGGLLDLLDDLVAELNEHKLVEAPEVTQDSLLEKHIRQAQSRLKRETKMPFFVTRFCTKEIATQESLSLGTDFDEYLPPMDYIAKDWTTRTGRIETAWSPIKSVELLRLTLQDGGLVTDIWVDWLNVDPQQGVIHVTPHMRNAHGSLAFQSLGFFPFYRTIVPSGLIPNMVHLRYTAGLVERVAADGESEYDPDEYPLNSQWDQNMLQEYQEAISHFAASEIISKLASVKNRGGATVSMYGVSEQVNPQVMKDQAKDYETAALEWAKQFKQSQRGIPIVFV